MIVVTTPTGKIGSQVIPHLLAANEAVRVVARHPAKLAPEVRNRVEVVIGPLDDEATMQQACEGAESVFLVVPPSFTENNDADYYLRFTRPALMAIKSQGVKRVVDVSVLGRGTEFAKKAGPITASLAKDEGIERSGVEYRALWCPALMENMLNNVQTIKQQGLFYSPSHADLKTPQVATKDVGAMGARFLLDRTWRGQGGSAVLGPEDLSFNDMAGLGDAVQMLQYAKRLRDVSAEIRYEVPLQLRALLPYVLGLAGGDAAARLGSGDYQPHHVECEMMELPYLFRTKLEDLPLATNYLALPEPISARYSVRMGRQARPRVGIVWAGGEWDRDRWIPFELLKPLLSENTYEWWNLQGGSVASQGDTFPLKRLCRNSDSGLIALAAVISNLDLIITVDTLAAHLSAAVGRPTWLMLKHDADWRWLSEGHSSPWYPSMRLFRQSCPCDWSGVVAAVGQALKEAKCF